jgi:ABC-type transport system involved in multi-copper enzyme maturation permease subunit
MYAWKCWRETRACFIFLLTGFAAMAVIVVLVPGLHERNGWWSFDRREYTHDPAMMVRYVSMMVLSILWGAGILAAGFLGVTSPGSEIEPGTIEYLWTRPRTRSSLNWRHWAVCVTETLIVAVVPAYLAAGLLGALTKNWNQWLLLLAPLLLALVGLPMLGLASVMAAWRRSSLGGLIVTTGIVVSYMILRQIAIGPLHLNLPPLFMGPVAWLMNYYTPSRTVFPWGACACVIAFAAALPLIAEWLLQRAEV